MVSRNSCTGYVELYSVYDAGLVPSEVLIGVCRCWPHHGRRGEVLWKG